VIHGFHEFHELSPPPVVNGFEMKVADALGSVLLISLAGAKSATIISVARINAIFLCITAPLSKKQLNHVPSASPARA
jgi:hypothetical protein